VIPNVTRGAKTSGVLRHLVGKGECEEHEYPHLVAGSPEAVRMAEERELTVRDAGELARFLDKAREQFGTKVTIPERDRQARVTGTRDAHVWHCSLALHPDEPELSNQRWSVICALDGMGVNERREAPLDRRASRRARGARPAVASLHDRDRADSAAAARGRHRPGGVRARGARGRRCACGVVDRP
jgi:hypothetical protein